MKVRLTLGGKNAYGAAAAANAGPGASFPRVTGLATLLPGMAGPGALCFGSAWRWPPLRLPLPSGEPSGSRSQSPSPANNYTTNLCIQPTDKLLKEDNE